MTSIYKISEQIKSLLGKGTIQEISEHVKQAYAIVVKKSWYENKEEGISEINGSLIQTYTNITVKKDGNRLYIDIPSAYLELPHEMGINYVGLVDGEDSGFIRLPSMTLGLFRGLKSFTFGGRQCYTVEGNRIYFDKMKDIKSNVMLKLSIAFDGIDNEEEFNISPVFIQEIINIVLERFSPKEKSVPNNLA